MAEEAEGMLFQELEKITWDHDLAHLDPSITIQLVSLKSFKKSIPFLGHRKIPMENIHPKKRTSDPNGAIPARFPLEVACWLRDLGLVAYILRRSGTHWGGTVGR